VRTESSLHCSAAARGRVVDRAARALGMAAAAERASRARNPPGGTRTRTRMWGGATRLVAPRIFGMLNLSLHKVQLISAN